MVGTLLSHCGRPGFSPGLRGTKISQATCPLKLRVYPAENRIQFCLRGPSEQGLRAIQGAAGGEGEGSRWGKHGCWVPACRGHQFYQPPLLPLPGETGQSSEQAKGRKSFLTLTQHGSEQCYLQGWRTHPHTCNRGPHLGGGLRISSYMPLKQGQHNLGDLIKLKGVSNHKEL